MENFSRARFEQLVDGATVLSDGWRGPGVYLTGDGRVVKVFRQKGLLTSNRLHPYARRFERNARRLAARGFASVSVETLARCRDLNIHLVIYPLLAGATLRELSACAGGRRALQRLPGYLCALHQSGVYCQALHLGQVLVRECGSFALIDMHSTQFSARPVSVRRRAKNLFNLLRYAEDRAALVDYDLRRFFGDYLQCCELRGKQRAALLGRLGNSPSFPELEQALSDFRGAGRRLGVR